MASTLVICDIDGVLADCSRRLHFLDDKDYDNFYGLAMAEDTVIEQGKDFVSKMVRGYSIFDDARVWYLTSRPERTATITRMWLKNRISFFSEHSRILMRPDGDHLPSSEMKVKLLKQHRKALKDYEDIYFIDDDPYNVAAVEKAFPQITGLIFTPKRF